MFNISKYKPCDKKQHYRQNKTINKIDNKMVETKALKDYCAH